MTTPFYLILALRGSLQLAFAPMPEENPWPGLAEKPPFVLREDDEVLRRYPKLRENLRLDFLPVPFLGSDRANTLLLTLNPGGRTNDLAVGETFFEARRLGACPVAC